MQTSLFSCTEPSHFCVSSSASAPSPSGTMEISSSHHLDRCLTSDDLEKDDAELFVALCDGPDSASRGKPSSTDLDREEAWERKKAQYLPEDDEDGYGEDDEEYDADEGFCDALSEHSSEGVCSSGCDEGTAHLLDDKGSGKHIKDHDYVDNGGHDEDFCTETRLQKPPGRAPIGIGSFRKRPTCRASAKPIPMRTRSLTDEDLEELRGSIDLGFGFSYNERCKLTNTLPALELYYAINKNYVDARACSSPASPLEGNALLRTNSTGSTSSPSSESWRISSPGDHPSQVKTRLRHWAQAVACSVKQGY